MKKKLLYLFVITLGLVLLISCSNKKEPVRNSAEQAEPLKLAIGLMPAVDTAPIFLARDKGYFSEEGLELEITLFTNAQDRQSALQAGEIDGAMTDLVALTVNRSGGFPIRATTLTDGMFPILVQKGSEDKDTVKIGLMEISVSNFLVDEWLSSDYQLEKVYINSIPARLEAVASGQLDMGLFPEPIASVGILKGLDKMIFSPVDGYCPDVMAFTDKGLAKKEALEIFHRGIDRAVEDINKDENEARDTLMKNIPNLKPDLRDLIQLPEYHKTRLPDEAFLVKIIDWTDSITSQSITVDPADLVDSRFQAQ